MSAPNPRRSPDRQRTVDAKTIHHPMKYWRDTVPDQTDELTTLDTAIGRDQFGSRVRTARERLAG
jgi:hypothetical protein